MKVKKCVYSHLFLILFLVCFLLAATSVKADIGGGSGEALTPYVPGSVVTEEEVSEIKMYCMTNRRIRDLPIEGTNVTLYGEQVGFAYMRNRELVDGPVFKFQGQSPDDQDSISVDFSDVRSFTVLKVKKKILDSDLAWVQVTVFPKITIKKLLESKPSYTSSTLI